MGSVCTTRGLEFSHRTGVDRPLELPPDFPRRVTPFANNRFSQSDEGNLKPDFLLIYLYSRQVSSIRLFCVASTLYFGISDSLFLFFINRGSDRVRLSEGTYRKVEVNRYSKECCSGTVTSTGLIQRQRTVWSC